MACNTQGTKYIPAITLELNLHFQKVVPRSLFSVALFIYELLYRSEASNVRDKPKHPHILFVLGPIFVCHRLYLQHRYATQGLFCSRFHSNLWSHLYLAC
jgi:hypothetical protein